MKNMTIAQKESLAYQKIKANDKAIQLLQELENVIRKLYNPLSEIGQSEILIYKDREGNEINMYDFYDDLQHFIDMNDYQLRKNSAECYETIKKIRK